MIRLFLVRVNWSYQLGYQRTVLFFHISWLKILRNLIVINLFLMRLINNYLKNQIKQLIQRVLITMMKLLMRVIRIHNSVNKRLYLLLKVSPHLVLLMMVRIMNKGNILVVIVLLVSHRISLMQTLVTSLITITLLILNQYLV